MPFSARVETATESARDDAHLEQHAPDFSLVLGGPLYQLLRKSHLEGDAMELLYRRVLAAILLTWVPLLLLSTFGSNAGIIRPISFFHDIEVHARFLAALPILIGAELLVHSRLSPAIRKFLEWRIVLPQDTPLFRKAVDSAVRIRNSVRLRFRATLGNAHFLNSFR